MKLLTQKPVLEKPEVNAQRDETELESETLEDLKFESDPNTRENNPDNVGHDLEMLCL